MWFDFCDNPHAFQRLYDSPEGLDRLRLFEIVLRQESHLQLRFALPRFPDHPPPRWSSEASEAQVVINCWLVEGFRLEGWAGESAGTFSLERHADRLNVAFLSQAVRLECSCRGARIDRFDAYATDE